MPCLGGAHGVRPAKLLRVEPMAMQLHCHSLQGRGRAARSASAPYRNGIQETILLIL